MIDADSPTGYRCRDCGRFCGCKYEWRGPAWSEVEHCENCCSDPSCFCKEESANTDESDGDR